MKNQQPTVRRIMTASHGLKVAETENFTMQLYREDTKEVYNLFQVVLKVNRTSKSGTKLVDAHSTYFVMAANAEDAIAQVSEAPINNPDSAMDGWQMLKNGDMTATSQQIPFYLRGWGLNCF